MNKLNVIKRDGSSSEFDIIKIQTAVGKTLDSVNTISKYETPQSITNGDFMIKAIDEINRRVDSDGNIDIFDIEDIVITELKKESDILSNTYKMYRDERASARYKRSIMHDTINSITEEVDRDNANVGNNFSAKLLRFASVTNKEHLSHIMPKEYIKAHDKGILHLHDLDSYNLTTNCLHLDTKAILESGFNGGYGYTRKPNSINAAGALSAIILQSSQNDHYGGQSHPNFDNDLSEYVGITRQKHIDELTKMNNEYNTGLNSVKISEIAEVKTRKDVAQSMQALLCNLNTMHSRAGSQVPFSTLNIGVPENDDAAMVCEMILKEYTKGMGNGEQFIFPNITFGVQKGINANENDKYRYLLELATKTTSRRSNPTYQFYDSKIGLELRELGAKPANMGCRTFIGADVNGLHGPVGRGNIASHSLNLPNIALTVGVDSQDKIAKFFDLLDERLLLTRETLLHRYDVLKKLKVKDIPFTVGQGMIRGGENLAMTDSIEPVLIHGTWGIGFVGLAETLVALINRHHGQTEDALKLGVSIIKRIRDFCDESKAKYNLNFTCYGTPAESLAGRFLNIDKKNFGVIRGVTDKEYYTNSFHIPVSFNISIASKMEKEGQFHYLCNAGHRTYIQFDSRPDYEIILDTLDYAMDNTDLADIAFDFPIRHCKKDGTSLENYETVCSVCSSDEIQGIARVTGYLSLIERFGDSKIAERKDRISHLNGKPVFLD